MRKTTIAASSGNPIDPEMNPGEALPPATGGADDHICPQCGGGGIRDDGSRCDHSGGTGKVSEGVGGP